MFTISTLYNLRGKMTVKYNRLFKFSATGPWTPFFNEKQGYTWKFNFFYVNKIFVSKLLKQNDVTISQEL